MSFGKYSFYNEYYSNIKEMDAYLRHHIWNGRLPVVLRNPILAAYRQCRRTVVRGTRAVCYFRPALCYVLQDRYGEYAAEGMAFLVTVHPYYDIRVLRLADTYIRGQQSGTETRS